MKSKLSNVLTAIINILIAIFMIQIYQAVEYINFAYVLGANIKIEILISAVLIMAALLNLINIIAKRSKKEIILCGATIILLIGSIVISANSIAAIIDIVWFEILAIIIIIVQIVYITISLRSVQEKNTNMAIAIIMGIAVIIVAAAICVPPLIQSKYNEYISEQKNLSEEEKNNNEELYIIKENEKYGYIDAKGNEIIPCKYDEIIQPFENKNLAILRENDNIVVVSRKNREALTVNKICNINFIEQLVKETSIEYTKVNNNYKENRYIALEKIRTNLYEYNDKYNLYYNVYYDKEQQKEVCDCKLIDRQTGEDYLIINTNKLPSSGEEIYIYRNYNIPYINDTERGFYTPDGNKYLVNSNNMYIVYFDNSNILFKNNDYYIFNNLQETFEEVYILNDIYIAKIKENEYKILDRNLDTKMENLSDVKICEDIIIYMQDSNKMGILDKTGEIIVEPKYEYIDCNNAYENKLQTCLEEMYK